MEIYSNSSYFSLCLLLFVLPFTLQQSYKTHDSRNSHPVVTKIHPLNQIHISYPYWDNTTTRDAQPAVPPANTHFTITLSAIDREFTLEMEPANDFLHEDAAVVDINGNIIEKIENRAYKGKIILIRNTITGRVETDEHDEGWTRLYLHEQTYRNNPFLLLNIVRTP